VREDDEVGVEESRLNVLFERRRVAVPDEDPRDSLALLDRIGAQLQLPDQRAFGIREDGGELAVLE
jgi:hypothetical protein